MMNHKQQPKNKSYYLPIPEGETIGYLTKMAVKQPTKGSRNKRPIYYFVIDHPIEHRFYQFFMPAFLENMIKSEDLLGELVVVYRNDNYIDISRVGEPIEID